VGLPFSDPKLVPISVTDAPPEVGAFGTRARLITGESYENIEM
jgi:hypothetical protein